MGLYILGSRAGRTLFVHSNGKGLTLKKLALLPAIVCLFIAGTAGAIEVDGSQSMTKKKFKTGFSGQITLENTTGLMKENPLFQTSLMLSPKWTFNKRMYVSARLDIVGEWTTSDTATVMNMSNLLFQFVANNIYTEKHTGIKFNGLARIYLPTSIESRRDNLVTAIGLQVGISKTFFKKLTIGYSFRFTKYFHTTEDRALDNEDDQFMGFVLQDPSQFTTGSMNNKFQLLHTFSLSLAITKKLSFGAYLMLINSRTYALPENDGYSAPGTTSSGERDLFWFITQVDYAFTKWFTASLGFSLYAPQLGPDGTLGFGEFFKNHNNYATIFVDAIFSF